MLHTARNLADCLAKRVFATCDGNWLNAVETVRHNAKLAEVIRTPTVNVSTFRLSQTEVLAKVEVIDAWWMRF